MKDSIIDKITNKDLRLLADKVVRGIPVSEADALFMLGTNDILELGLIADSLRTRLHGDIAYYEVNMNLNYTNVCELRCPLCAFSRAEGDAGAFTLGLDEIEDKVRQADSFGIDEVHIVGGLNPKLKIGYFEEMLRRIKTVNPDIFIVAFTAVEYDYFARLNGLPLEEVFVRMMNAGLGALPGGGAEVFSPRLRKVIAPRKIPAKRWLEVMRVAHSLGLKTNATLLYNHLETPADIVDHLSQIRALQDETGGFKTFVPLPYHDARTEIHARRTQTTGFGDVRLFAASRIFLHNVPHLKSLWMYLGEKMAQLLLRFGVDDLGGTYHYEKVVHSAGATTADAGSESHLRRLIEHAGLNPIRAAANYEMRRGQ
ncbi:MAG: CofH family radical SAM protein [Proteobacteria bacterium]|nr:CofH family radical SAM protein [Pseudomonadota bacterium]MBU2262214.1 CofH family radical SAM protein [Pseudomonadota bacterium]